jgi:hypothetical protein
VDKGQASDRGARPGIDPAEDAAPAGQLACDGEIFELRPDEFGGTHYTWLTGQNPGYGFSVSPTADDTEEQLAPAHPPAARCQPPKTRPDQRLNSATGRVS